MLLIPAIDLFKGSVVRLHKGKKGTAKVYSRSPKDVAKEWQGCGAQLIHVVDLDAAFGEGDNTASVKEVVAVGCPVQVGGGVRTMEKASRLLGLGAQRIIIGTKAVDQVFLNRLVKKFSDRVAIGVDVLEGKCVVSGWQEKTDQSFLGFVQYAVDYGVKWIIYTDVSRDGTLAGINFKEIEKLGAFKDIRIIISGGLRSIEEFVKVKDEFPFIYGVITGKALYEGTINLKEAIEQTQ